MVFVDGELVDLITKIGDRKFPIRKDRVVGLPPSKWPNYTMGLWGVILTSPGDDPLRRDVMGDVIPTWNLVISCGSVFFVSGSYRFEEIRLVGP